VGPSGAAKRLRRAAPSKPPTTRGSLAGGGPGVEPRSALVGTRLGIYWELDKIYYRVSGPGKALAGSEKLTMCSICRVWRLWLF
jgi:hypothetical protein